MSDPRYPIGEFVLPASVDPAQRMRWADEIASLPSQLRAAVEGLSDPQLDTPYRDQGWTLRQVVHHVADSHINSYTRFRLTLTEECPTIRPYYEERWAELEDARRAPVAMSLELLEALHARWVRLLRGLPETVWDRTLRHPDHPGVLPFDWLLGLYAWHGRHHTAHITELRRRMDW
ncbi:MAG: bacillithiol transferase BstA [Candidatus Eisenbacteria bacterium]|nr:bacillithiol transferase BstA [Candidatus Eisenbacteria bacterium]